MLKRRTGTNWTGLCRLIESNLSRQTGFPKDVRIEERLTANHDGLCHDNYFFTAAGHELVLRLGKRFRSIRTPEESRQSMPLEAETLRCLAGCSLPYPVPKLICTVADNSGEVIGLIESCLDGAPLSRFEGAIGSKTRLEVIAGVAAHVHQLPKAKFAHLAPCPASESHIRDELGALPPPLFEVSVAADARDWINAHITQRPSVLLHGDLLPQNLLWDFTAPEAISVIDWERARLGDPAYDLAIVTRGARKPIKESGGFERLLATYNAATGTLLPASAVRIHELLMHLRWLAETARQQAAGTLEGHGPEHYALMLDSMLGDFAASRNRTHRALDDRCRQMNPQAWGRSTGLAGPYRHPFSTPH